MAWNGSGSFARTNGVHTGTTTWQQDAAALVDIEADRHDTHDQDLSAGINACLAKNGENEMTGDLDLGDNDIVNGGAAAFTAVTVGGVAVVSYARTAAEISAGVTPVNYALPVRYITRYQANTTPGTTDMAAGLAAADLIGAPIIPAGEHLISTATDVENGLEFLDGGYLTIDDCEVNIDGIIVAKPAKIFEFSGTPTFKLTTPQDVWADWFDITSTSCVYRAFKWSYAGSRILLRGETYETIAIPVELDVHATDSTDTGKWIVGAGTAQRYDQVGTYPSTAKFLGSRLKLASGQTDPMFTVTAGGISAVTTQWGSGGISDVMLQGNKANSTVGTSDGIRLVSGRDWVIRNVYCWNFDRDGLNFDGAGVGTHQISMEGYVEVWNNNRDGVRLSSTGDPQWNATLRCVNNGRHGLYVSTAFGRFHQVYCYFNGTTPGSNGGVLGAGFRYDSTADDNLHINYLRCEDNAYVGADISGQNLSIDHAEICDNGVDGSGADEQAGIYLRATAENIRVRTLFARNRTAAAHNQRNLVYDLSIGGCTIDHMVDMAFGEHGVASEQTVLIDTTTPAIRCRYGSRRTVNDTYANLKGVGATVTPLPSTYGIYVVTAVTEAMTVSNTTASASPEGMTLEVRLTASGASRNIGWGTDYVDRDMVALTTFALGDGLTLVARFIRLGAKWLIQDDTGASWGS